MSADSYSRKADLNLPMDWNWKTIQKLPFTCQYLHLWSVESSLKILTSTTFTLDKFMILGPISGLQEVILDFSIFFQLRKKIFHGPKLWVKTPLKPEFQNHSDMKAYLRSHFCSNFNLVLYFFQGFFGPNLACMWSVCTSAFHICAYLSDLCKNRGLTDKF